MPDASTCYSYDPTSGLFLGTVAADPSPLEEGVWLIPGHATREVPPEPPAGQAPAWRAGAWSLLPDHRGETWWDAHGNPVVIAAIGDPGAAGLSSVPPPAAPPAPRQQLGNVFLGAVADLGWWGWFDGGAATQSSAGKPLDQRYWLAIGKADLVLATDAKLNRVARAAEAARVAASGQPAPAAPVITIAAVMDRGDAMVAAT